MWRELSCGGGNTSCCKGTPSPQCCPAERAGEQLDPSHLPGVWVTISNMRHQMDLLATVTVLGVLEQAYFMLQVIHTQQQHRISPPRTTGHPEFEQIFRAQVNCSEYFPVFTSLLWVAGIFFHQDRCLGNAVPFAQTAKGCPTPMCIKLPVATEKSLWGCSAASGLGAISPQLWLQRAGCSTSTPTSGTSRDMLRLRRDAEYAAGAVGAPNPPRELGVGCSPGAGFLTTGGTKGRFYTLLLLSCLYVLVASSLAQEGAVCFMPWVCWGCLMVFSPCAVWAHCMSVPGCCGCCWGWWWPGSWYPSCFPAAPHGWQCWCSPSSTSVSGERGHGSPKPSSVLTFEGRWMLALLCLWSSTLQREQPF
ncbi:leukotriene C4 synthase isoform X2 [Neopsephotus bourkii]|uniref:leukotriene C4 synthase isoform X2 n=1 Tax=Neopsephotus bourkii TaxID=309878 RepID=UPI002AA56FAC|nr:leukotriene C4 synthase isoform X2 [Neopsephotus bourkii]